MSTRRRAVALLGAGAIGWLALRSRQERLARFEEADPCGPHGSELPEGREQVVITDDGAELAVLVAGPDDGPTVVLVHCWTGRRSFWATVARRLVLAGHRVVLYDQRGHGLSTPGDLAPSIDAIGNDLHAVLTAVDARDAVLVGHSMGGMTIQSYAALHHEDFVARAKAVVLVATAARVLGRPVPARIIEALMGDQRADWSRRGWVGRATTRRSLGKVARSAHIDATLQGFAETSGAARAGFLHAMAGMDLRAGLGDIAVPTTVLVGTHDLLTPPRLARQLVDAIPGSTLVLLPGAGHMLPLEEPDRIVDAIRSIAHPGVSAP